MWSCTGEIHEKKCKDDAKIKSLPRKLNLSCVYRNKSPMNRQLKCVCRQTTGPFERGSSQICTGTADKRWAWLVQYLRGIRVSRTTCYSAGKGEEVTGINSLWLKKFPRLLQWIKQNVAERAGNSMSLFTPHNEEKLMADLASIFCLNFVSFLFFQDSKEILELITGIRKFLTLYHMTEWLIPLSPVPVDLNERGSTLCKM